MPWLLEIAIILSYFLGHYLEAVIIFILLTVNVIIGFVHARHSQKVLALLKKRIAVKAKTTARWSMGDKRRTGDCSW